MENLEVFAYVVVAVAAVVAVVVRLIQCLNPKATRRYHRRHPRGFLGSLCPSHRQRGGVPTYRTRGWSVCHFGLVYQAVPPTRKRRMHEEITRHALTHHTYAPLSPSYRTCTHTHANAVRARTHSLACSYEKVSTDIHIRTRTLTFVWSPVCDRIATRTARATVLSLSHHVSLVQPAHYTITTSTPGSTGGFIHAFSTMYRGGPREYVRYTWDAVYSTLRSTVR